MAIYYACTDRVAPAGGIKVIYRHVDLLNRHGLEAYVLHERPHFRCEWFPNRTPIRYWTDEAAPRPAGLRDRARARLGRAAPPRERLHLTRPPAIPLGADDVLVLPEGFGPGLAGIAPGIRKAIFNQNAYRTFHGYPANLEPEQTPYLHPDVLAVITISEDNRRYVGLAFPTVNVVRLHYSYDPVAFPFRAKKARRLAYMPRKNSFDAHQVLSILRLRGVLKGWEVTVIDGMSEAQTSAVLQEASIFLSFGHPEGCPLPPAEAMLAGAIVIGYHGMGGREYFKTEHAFPIDVGDISAFAETAESVLAEFDVDDSRLRALAERAAAYIRATYPPEQEEREVVALWRSLTA